MKKVIFFTAIFLVALQQVAGQVPQKFSYQAVLRNADGTVFANQTVSIKITLHQKTVDGAEVYTEEHSVTIDNGQGIVSLFIGGGTVLSGTFATIPWSETIFIQVDVKTAGQAEYQTIGTSQIVSVPYALHALSADNAIQGAGVLGQTVLYNGTQWVGNNRLTVSDNSVGVLPSSVREKNQAIFAVLNSANDTVFAVYENGVTVNISDGVKGSRGGFAIGGLTNKATAGVEYLRITPDSARIYIDDTPTTKGSRGGFAIGGLTNQAKSVTKDYFKVTPDTSYFTTTLFAESNIISTGTISTAAGVISDTLLKDVDGNTYKTVKIGNQIWMQENLKVTKYSVDSSAIASYDMYSPSTDTLLNYGSMYSISATTSILNVCPDGWHVPTDADWTELLVFVGGNEWVNSSVTTGLKLIEPSPLWLYPINANNVTGFSGRPGGSATIAGNCYYNGIGTEGNWWRLGQGSIRLDGITGSVGNTGYMTGAAYSVRCLKGAPLPSK